MSTLFDLRVESSIGRFRQRTLCFNGRVDLLRFRVRADIFVDLPVLLCKGRTVSGEPGKDKQGRHTSSHIGRHLPIKKASGPHEPHGMW